jgi:hypothetical protein
MSTVHPDSKLIVQKNEISYLELIIWEDDEPIWFIALYLKNVFYSKFDIPGFHDIISDISEEKVVFIMS